MVVEEKEQTGRQNKHLDDGVCIWKRNSFLMLLRDIYKAMEFILIHSDSYFL